MPVLLQILIATFIVSLIAILAVVVFLRKKTIKNLTSLISLAAGVLLAFTWLDLIPEASHGIDIGQIGLIVLITIIILFVIENVFHWHHCRHKECEETDHKHLIVFNLFGDGLHNLIDGIIIASTFMVDVRLGIVTTIAVLLHEIPQELADVGILIYSGLSKKKVLIYNYVFALTAIVGALLTYFFIERFEYVIPYLLAVVAGNFIYLSLSDLVPIIHHTSREKVKIQIFWFIFGVVLIYLFGVFIRH